MKIEIMYQHNLREIYEFERDNREFFLKNLPPRPEGYFSFSSFARLMADILEEQNRRECAMYIIRDEEGAMAGRINLTSMGEGRGEVGHHQSLVGC